MIWPWYKKEKPLMGLTGLGGGSDSLGITGLGAWAASGGTKVSTPAYHYHVFTYPNSDTFSVSGAGSVTCTYIVAAGGGGGGSSVNGTNATANAGGAGGGAGGLLSGTVSLSAGTFPVSVGDGGDGNISEYNRDDGGPANGYGVAGVPSSIAFPSAVTALGGGGGENVAFRKHRGPAPWNPNPYGNAWPNAGDAIINGGSGGGCSSTPGPAYSPSSPKGPFLGGLADVESGTYPNTAGTPGQGNVGGVGYLDGQYGGGGGGAGGAGGYGQGFGPGYNGGGGAGGEGGNVGPVMDLSDIQPAIPSPSPDWAESIGIPGSFSETRLCGGGAGSGRLGDAANWYGGGRSLPTGLQPTIAIAGAGRGWVSAGPGGSVPGPAGAQGGAGTSHTGGGGGGGTQKPSPDGGPQTLGGAPVGGGKGGSGLVVIRYPV